MSTRPYTDKDVLVSEARLRRLESKAHSGRVTLSINTWMGIAGIGLSIVIAIATLLMFAFTTKTETAQSATTHQTTGHPDIREDVREAKRKAAAAVHNTIQIGVKVGASDLKTGDE